MRFLSLRKNPLWYFFMWKYSSKYWQCHHMSNTSFILMDVYGFHIKWYTWSWVLHSKLRGRGVGCVFHSKYIYVCVCVCGVQQSNKWDFFATRVSLFLIRRSNLSWVCLHGASHVLFLYFKGFWAWNVIQTSYHQIWA